jgi:beta-glucosidase-like glycosyl hydrolase
LTPPPCRDPRWGRAQEVPGEDPFLTGRYAAAMVVGLQGAVEDPLHSPRFRKVTATCKHYLAYSLEHYGLTDRHHFNAAVSRQELVETFLPAFEACVEGGGFDEGGGGWNGAGSVMCAYNAVTVGGVISNEPACASEFLLSHVLRATLGFKGFVVSDCGAISDAEHRHNFTHDDPSTVAAALRAVSRGGGGLIYF